MGSPFYKNKNKNKKYIYNYGLHMPMTNLI